MQVKEESSVGCLEFGIIFPPPDPIIKRALVGIRIVWGDIVVGVGKSLGER